MKNKFKILYSLLGLVVLFTACSPNQYELGTIVSKDELKFSIIPDAKDPNLIVLKSSTPGVTPQWITPLGRSTQVQDTVRIAFPGKYKFVYGALSAGGFVQADTLTLNITTTNLSYVNDPLWTLLCGGAGKEKTWVYDLNAQGVSKFFSGPAGFAGDETVAPWTYFPTYVGNEWLGAAGDYGTMTFSLKGGPYLTVNHLLYPSGLLENGTYFLDVPTKKLTFTNVTPLNNGFGDVDYTKGVIYSITENSMQIGFHNKVKPELCVLNFTTKEFSDNWVAPVVSKVEPINKSFTKNDLVGTWKYALVAQNWINWAPSGQGASFGNNWFTRENMITALVSWGGSASTFTNNDPNTYVFNTDGTCNLNGITNTYTVANGVITFDKPLTGTEWNLIYITLTGSKVSVLNVTSIGDPAIPYKSNGIWIGTKNGDKPEDQAVQLIKQ